MVAISFMILPSTVIKNGQKPWVHSQGFSFYSKGGWMENNNYYEPFQLIKIEKISDDIFHMGRNLMIRICSNLAKSVNGNRYFFYKEYEYEIGDVSKVSIKRGFDYYLSIEEVTKPKDGRNKIFIRIGPSEFYGFIDLIQEAMKWFTSVKYKQLYAKKGGELVFGTSTIPSKTLSGLPLNMSITFAPHIIDNGKEFKPAVKIIIDNGIDIADFYMSVDNLFGIYGALVNYNMFISAQIMVSSLGIQLGTNRINMNHESKSNQLPTSLESVKQDTGGINGRVIGGDKLENLE